LPGGFGGGDTRVCVTKSTNVVKGEEEREEEEEEREEEEEEEEEDDDDDEVPPFSSRSISLSCRRNLLMVDAERGAGSNSSASISRLSWSRSRECEESEGGGGGASLKSNEVGCLPVKKTSIASFKRSERGRSRVPYSERVDLALESTDGCPYMSAYGSVRSGERWRRSDAPIDVGSERAVWKLRSRRILQRKPERKRNKKINKGNEHEKKLMRY